MLDFIYHMTLNYLKSQFWRENVKISLSFTQRFSECDNAMLLNL